VLNARDTEINDSDVARILEALSPAKVVALDLSGNLLRDGAARALADWKGALRHLDLRGNVMSEDAREELRAVYRDRVLL
jgi:Ran GTPase-activating protein (RanGAP) involved in mRNA processing and transport